MGRHAGSSATCSARRTAAIQGLGERPSVGTLVAITLGMQHARSFFWSGMAGDLRYALRSFSRAPALPAAIVATLALGLGATAAIFAVVNAVLLRPLPYADA